MGETPPLIAVVGETASGKSALALEIAQICGGEIVCADAYTVYSGFDIGTAKPTKAEQTAVRHHVLDIADPAKGFSVAQFKTRADTAIADIQSRGKAPILVGGSGLYIDAVLYNYQFSSSENRYERDVLNTMSVAELVQLAQADGLDTGRIDAQNPRRIIRLLERNGEHASRSNLRPGACVVGIQNERASLAARIEARVSEMIEAGLETEVRKLSERYGWDIEPMKAIGYREWRPYFSGEATLAQTREAIELATRQLAKKQRTWFKRNQDIHWFLSRTEAAAFAENWLIENNNTGQAINSSATPYDRLDSTPTC